MKLQLQACDVVEVLWQDAESHDAWMDQAELEQYVAGDGLVVTVGLLLQENEQLVVLAGARDDAGKHASVWKIPRALVRSIRTVGRAGDARTLHPKAARRGP